MRTLIGMLQALGLSTASGFNAYVPLLVVGVLGRFGLIQLNPPYDLVTNPIVLAVLVVVAIFDFIADKIPVMDHVLHVPGLIIHPAAGAVLALMAADDSGAVNPAVFAVCGLLLSGGLHVGRTAVRPVSTAATAGFGNPVISLCEDCVSLLLAVLAVVVPVLAAVFTLLVIALFSWFVYTRLRARRLRLASAIRPQTAASAARRAR